MAKLEEIKATIASLPEEEYAELQRWFANRDWARWDKEIESDSAACRLELLHEEAEQEKREGYLDEL